MCVKNQEYSTVTSIAASHVCPYLIDECQWWFGMSITIILPHLHMSSVFASFASLRLISTSLLRAALEAAFASGKQHHGTSSFQTSQPAKRNIKSTMLSMLNLYSLLHNQCHGDFVFVTRPVRTQARRSEQRLRSSAGSEGTWGRNGQGLRCKERRARS